MTRPIWTPPHLTKLFREQVLHTDIDTAAVASNLLPVVWRCAERTDAPRRSWLPASALNKALRALQPELYDAPRITLRELRSLPGAVVTVPQAARWLHITTRTWQRWEEDHGFAPAWLPYLYEASANVARGSTAAGRAAQRDELAALCARHHINRAEFCQLVHNPARGGAWLSGRVAMPEAEFELFRRICAERAAAQQS